MTPPTSDHESATLATLPHGLRVGCVRYLNSKPLIHGHAESVAFQHPAILADDLAAGRLDVGLVPTFELLRSAGGYRVVDDVAIACSGRVHSVFLAYRGDLASVQTIRLDPASRTSVNLLRVLLAEFHGLTPRYEALTASDFGDEEAALASGEGVLLIGDQAIAFRHQSAAGGKGCRFFDLGEQWQLATGLPFVFAAWLIRSETPDPARIGATLRAWREAGCRQMARVIAEADSENVYPPGFAEFYLTRCIRYRLGTAEKQAIAEYGRLLHRHRLIDAAPPAELAWV